MAIFGEGLGADPMADARRRAALREETQRLATVRDLGAGKSGIVKGGIALGERAGSILGRGIAGAFGLEQPDAPEVAAAKEQVALLEQFNAVEGDKSTAEYARNLAKSALGAGRQDLAFQFGQVAAERDSAEKALVAKAEAAKADDLRQSYSALPREMKLSQIAVGDRSLLTTLGVTDSEQQDTMIEDARQSLESLQIKNKADAAKIRRTLDTSLSKTEIDSASKWMNSVGMGVETSIWATAEDEAAGNEASAMRIAAKAKELRVNAQEGSQVLSEADSLQMAVEALTASGEMKSEPSTGGLFSAPKGSTVILGWELPSPQAAPANDGAQPGQRRGIVLK